MQSIIRTIAIALNTEMTDFGWNDLAICENYPGSCWMPHFRKLAEKEGFRVELAKTVRAEVDSGVLLAQNVGIVQVDDEPDGAWLLAKGATGLVIQHGESPMTIPDFYSALARKSAPFRQAYFFRGALPHLPSQQASGPMLFPAYSDADRLNRVSEFDQTVLGVSQRTEAHLLSLVASNNYWRRVGFGYYRKKPRKLLQQWSKSPEGEHYRWSKKHQLHDYRLRAIQFFGKKGEIDFYGPRWGSHPIPVPHSKRIVRRAWKGSAQDKKSVLSRSRFNLATENCVFSGYVTEKIFHAFVAGVVPVYLGAPDIEDFVPRGAFVDARQFKSLRQLRAFLLEMDDDAYAAYLYVARNFLASDEGYQHTYEAYARRIFSAACRD